MRAYFLDLAILRPPTAVFDKIAKRFSLPTPRGKLHHIHELRILLTRVAIKLAPEQPPSLEAVTELLPELAQERLGIDDLAGAYAFQTAINSYRLSSAIPSANDDRAYPHKHF